MRFGILPVLSILAGFTVNSMIPSGAFGGYAYDVAGHAIVAGAVAALTGWLFIAVSKRWGSSKAGQ
jgi:hypothetical protein